MRFFSLFLSTISLGTECVLTEMTHAKSLFHLKKSKCCCWRHLSSWCTSRGFSWNDHHLNSWTNQSGKNKAMKWFRNTHIDAWIRGWLCIKRISLLLTVSVSVSSSPLRFLSYSNAIPFMVMQSKCSDYVFLFAWSSIEPTNNSWRTGNTSQCDWIESHDVSSLNFIVFDEIASFKQQQQQQ